ncbi:MAG TPA: hypothetical protein PK453_02625 [Leptospiraceae bacterium]|nr:hypothetical protein [Leptospiraceae bacterium]HMY69611.1 hypothetical protein [Leptospiraceae bacterium]HNF12536.1 hypothetical protein [Leptospiraceae bacterium]HNF26717.1 hypothetical protein [Leptospiraceae bacterium]HNI26793.1 hypothetical protein [Leptospiraceae bacterium]
MKTLLSILSVAVLLNCSAAMETLQSEQGKAAISSLKEKAGDKEMQDKLKAALTGGKDKKKKGIDPALLNQAGIQTPPSVTPAAPATTPAPQQ